MEDLGPKQMVTIIVRPCYDSNGEIESTKKNKPIGNARFIGELYVLGKLRHQTLDYDNETAAYESVALAIIRTPNLLRLKED